MQNAFPHSRDRICLIHGGMDTPTRIASVSAFTDELDHRGLRKSKQNFQFLLGTTRMLGTGFTFVRACNLVLIGADWQHVVEKQAYGRVHRIGQENKRSFSYRLINEAHTVERRTLARQAQRNEVKGTLLAESERAGLVDKGVWLRSQVGYQVDLRVLELESNEHVSHKAEGVEQL